MSGTLASILDFWARRWVARAGPDHKTLIFVDR
jgi:hypothetical protein